MIKKYLELAEKVGKVLTKNNLKLVTAESCTGGFIAQVVTSIAGSSSWFERGFVTYSNEAKSEELNVPANIIKKHGAVSESTVIAMAQGALANSHAQISVAVTGIAGPTGGTTDKPVGTVWFGFAKNDGSLQVICKCFSGDRTSIREQAVKFALLQLIEFIID